MPASSENPSLMIDTRRISVARYAVGEAPEAACLPQRSGLSVAPLLGDQSARLSRYCRVDMLCPRFRGSGWLDARPIPWTIYFSARRGNLARDTQQRGSWALGYDGDCSQLWRVATVDLNAISGQASVPKKRRTVEGLFSTSDGMQLMRLKCD